MTGQFVFGLIAQFLIGTFALATDWIVYTTSNSPIPTNHIRSVCIDSAAVKWFGSSRGLIRYDGATWTTFTTTDQLADNGINDISAIKEISTEQALWIATDNGVSTINLLGGDSLIIADALRQENSGLVSNTVYAVASDKEQVRWFGTNQGLSLLIGSVWESYSQFDLLTSNIILSITAGLEGWKYLATAGGGVNRLRYDAVDGITSASAITRTWSGIASDTVFAVFIDSGDVKWYGTRHGLSRHEGSNTQTNWTTFTTSHGLIHDHVLAIAGDKEGGIWLGTAGGVSRLYNDHWQSWTKDNGLPGDTINDIAADRDGSLWFASNAGIAHLISVNVALPHIDTQPLPSNFTLKAYPNPFNQSTKIYLRTSYTGTMKIRIYNRAGIHVLELFEGLLPAGDHVFYWDGSDRKGLHLSSGLYFLQARTGHRQQTLKLVLLR